ncbi:hypothetical protein [Christiangramia salexigens]|uniref:Vitellogenin II n=1 Tax=Christiangramia salexigens TaxID=1913577 RepID=A0A1L3J802_9FLAO|nr:hypothetical protein [Christiangramia salexigens]APG61250.1 hypothetical protein LPB144_12910 [Christiangramia salexigens]
MKLYHIIRKKLGLLAIPALLISMASCSSYQYSGYEADGIYGESRPGIWEQEEPQNNQVKPNGNNTYYKNLFAQQSEMYGEILENDVFTDVESYSSNDGYDDYNEVGGDVAYVRGNAPWGQDPDSYTINIYNNGMYGGFYSPWRYGYAYNYFPFYDPWYYPSPWRGYGYGYAGSYWNFGFNFGFGWGGRPYGYGPYNTWYNNYFYGYRPYYYSHRHTDIVYNSGRRNSRVYYSDGENRRISSSDRNSSYSRSIRDIRNSGSSERTSRVRSSAVNSDNRQIYTRTNRRTQSTRSYNYGRDSRTRTSSPNYERSSRNSNRTYRSSPSRRSNTSTRPSSVRSSGSSSRSSGTTPSRSSGSSRSSRGGRGN